MAGKLKFNKLGPWWNNNVEIDSVGIDGTGNDIVFTECKYRTQPMDTDVFCDLLRKKELVPWEKENRIEKFVLFSISGFTERLRSMAIKRKDLLLFGGDGQQEA
jgi:hypothetical protein